VGVRVGVAVNALQANNSEIYKAELFFRCLDHRLAKGKLTVADAEYLQQRAPDTVIPPALLDISPVSSRSEAPGGVAARMVCFTFVAAPYPSLLCSRCLVLFVL
jgi:hypothetical protein